MVSYFCLTINTASVQRPKVNEGLVGTNGASVDRVNHLLNIKLSSVYTEFVICLRGGRDLYQQTPNREIIPVALIN